MGQELQGLKIAILVTDGFEEIEMTDPRKHLEKQGAIVSLVSPAGRKVQAFKHLKKADSYKVDVELDRADAEDFDALVLPGGVVNPDALRMDEKAVAFVKHFVEQEKPIAAICHGPWTLINAGGVRGRHMTSWPSLKADLTNAGAEWTDEAVVADGPLVTSRKPDDLPKFDAAMVELFARSKRLPSLTERLGAAL